MKQRPERPVSRGYPDGPTASTALSRRQFLAAVGAAGTVLLWPRGPAAASVVRAVSARTRDSVAMTWNAAFLQGVRDSKLGPPMVSRALAIVHTCMYDAWAAYDPLALGTQLGGTLCQAETARTGANRAEAVSFAAFRALADLFPHRVRPWHS